MKVITLSSRISNPVDTSETNMFPSLLIETKCYTPAELLKYAVQGVDVMAPIRVELDDEFDDVELSDDPLVDLAEQQAVLDGYQDEILNRTSAKGNDTSVTEKPLESSEKPQESQTSQDL